ncbi:hypothetical protein CBE01nite_16190 [Clostridium beijerinckii]|nr:hypothetical protein CBE01nite_16190 [Clostridium beijerinckii]
MHGDINVIIPSKNNRKYSIACPFLISMRFYNILPLLYIINYLLKFLCNLVTF